MRRLIVSNIMSLDGAYVEGPHWPLEIMDAAFDAYNLERMKTAGTLLTGRVTFEGFRDFWPSVADDPDERWTPTHREISRLNTSIDKVVVSDTLTPEQTKPYSNAEIVKRDDAHERVAELRRDTGGDILIFGSLTLWTDLLAHDLVDEVHVMIGPIVRAGKPMFESGAGLSLRLLDTRTWPDSGNVLVRYAVSR
jgi:dihydrofolate reductase